MGIVKDNPICLKCKNNMETLKKEMERDGERWYIAIFWLITDFFSSVFEATGVGSVTDLCGPVSVHSSQLRISLGGRVPPGVFRNLYPSHQHNRKFPWPLPGLAD